MIAKQKLANEETLFVCASFASPSKLLDEKIFSGDVLAILMEAFVTRITSNVLPFLPFYRILYYIIPVVYGDENRMWVTKA